MTLSEEEQVWNQVAKKICGPTGGCGCLSCDDADEPGICPGLDIIDTIVQQLIKAGRIYVRQEIKRWQ